MLKEDILTWCASKILLTFGLEISVSSNTFLLYLFSWDNWKAVDKLN